MVQIPRLTEWRKARALTQVELAERAGVSSRTVAGLEAGDSARLRTVRKLAEGLGVPVEELTGPPSGLEQFLAVHTQQLEQIRETVALLGEVAGTPGEWEGISAEEAERRLGYLQRVVRLLGESTQTATQAAREALATERGDDPKEAVEDAPPAKRNPGEDRLATLLAAREATGTG